MIKQVLKGDGGVYLYENNTTGDLMLPRPASNGRNFIVKGGQFQGDSYFMNMVRNNELKFIKTIVPPAVAENSTLTESVTVENSKKEVLVENKLILDQPDTVTATGTVEYVTPSKKILKEDKRFKKEKNGVDEVTLIVENPLDGVEILQLG
jgi:hypothetical protein